MEPRLFKSLSPCSNRHLYEGKTCIQSLPPGMTADQYRAIDSQLCLGCQENKTRFDAILKRGLADILKSIEFQEAAKEAVAPEIVDFAVPGTIRFGVRHYRPTKKKPDYFDDDKGEVEDAIIVEDVEKK